MEYLFTTQDYADDISKDFNKVWYVNLIAALGKQLDGLKDRFDKSDIIEQAIVSYSNERFRWVDQIGQDIFDTKWHIGLEIKYQTNVIFTPRNKPKANIKIRLKNNLRVNNGIRIKHPAEYYMICQQNAIGIISYRELKPYLLSVSDGIEVSIPFGKLCFVFKPSNITLNTFDINYKLEKTKIQNQIINQVKKVQIHQ